MNCKPGDLARFVAPWIEKGRGRYVTVLRRPTLDDWREAESATGAPVSTKVQDDCWTVEGDIVLWCGPVRRFVVHDDSLRPIRPDGITDEEVRELYAPKLPEGAPA